MDEFLEEIVLTNAHSMIASHISERLKLSDKLGTSVIDQAKFGFFGDAPSFNTFYPDAKPEDFTPGDADYIQPLFRMLSNTVVISNKGLIEFPSDVLRASVNKLPGMAVYPNHDDQVGNELGVVLDTVWQEAYELNGLKIPAGINGRVKIDAKANPRIARGINMNPPSIHSVSCTVVYRWKPSHKFEKEWEFYDKMGTRDDKGELIRKIATEILYYSELSLVSGGADPYAKKLGEDGKIILPNFADAQHVDANAKFSYSIDWAKPIDMDTASFSKEKEKTNNKKEENMNEQLLQAVALALGLTLTQDNYETELANFKAAHDKMVNPESMEIGEFKGFEAIKTEFERRGTELAAQAEKSGFIAIGEARLQEVRDEATRLYKLTLAEGEKEDEGIINLIKDANFDSAVSLQKQYQATVDEKVPMTCSKCGSHEITRASAKREDEPKSKEATSFDDIRTRMVDQVYRGME